MRRTLLFFIAVTLSACVSDTSVYYAEGVAVSTREADEVRCEARAYEQYPIRNETRYTPRVFVLPEEVCDSAGNCVLTPGFFEGGDPYTVDINERPRRVAGEACMADQGYARITLPRCENGTIVFPSPTMPRLTETSCVRRNSLGDEIVTPLQPL